MFSIFSHRMFHTVNIFLSAGPFRITGTIGGVVDALLRIAGPDRPVPHGACAA